MRSSGVGGRSRSVTADEGVVDADVPDIVVKRKKKGKM